MVDSWEATVEVARDVALERTDDLPIGAVLRSPARDIGAGVGIEDRADHDDPIEGQIGAPILTAAQSFPGGESRGGVDRGDPTEMGEGGLAGQVLRVAADGDEQCAGRVGSHPKGSDHVGSSGDENVVPELRSR